MKTNRSLLAFGLFWLFLTLVFDGFPAYMMVEDLKTSSYVAAHGHILESHVDTVVSHSTKGGQSTTYQPRISYTYEASGRQMRGDHLTSVSFSSSGGYASQKVAEYPAGAPVQVYYDPKDPSTSVLEKGLQGAPFFILLFLVPFNCVGLLLIRLSRLSDPFPETPGIQVVNERGKLLCSTSPFDRFATLMLITFGTGFAMAILFVVLGGMTPSVPVAMGEWIALLAVTTLFYKMKVSSPREPELVLVPTRGEISFSAKTLKFSDITDVTTIAQNSRYTLQITRAGGESSTLFLWAKEADAELFAAWLKRQIGM